MSKRFCLSVCLLASIVAGPITAQSIVPIDPATVTDGHVYLMENVGANVPDDSANNNNGTFVGSPQVVPGLNGSALQFNGTSDAVVLPNAATINTSTHQNKTYIAVFKCTDVSKSEKQCVFEEGGSTRGVNIYVHQGLVYAGGWNAGDYTPQWAATFHSAPIGSDEWHVVAAVLRDGTAGQADDKFEMWMDGELIAKGPGGELRSRTNANGIGYTTQTKYHDGNFNTTGGYLDGVVDEIWILNQALSEAELAAAKIGSPAADDPVPADGAVDVPRDVVLAWKPVESAGARDVYLGAVFDDVNEATRTNPMGVLVGQGQTDLGFDTSDLVYGQTYYWRVDEVNGAPDNTIFRGSIWSFTVEPYAYPIPNVTATASSYQPGMDPNNTVNGAGLDADDQHSTNEMQMWMSGSDGARWIQFAFDQEYKLDELWVWNSNQMVESFVGFGAKDVTIEYSLDGEAWTALEGVPEFARADGTPTYTANTTVDFGRVTARYVKLTIDSSWGGLPQAGLSEVRFHYIPVQAFYPEPAAGATGVSVETDLDWRPGREAGAHEVSLGADPNALTLVDTVTEHGYTPAALNLGTTYYWKVDEVNATGSYEGEGWSFTTEEYAVVEDFESYDDDVDAETTIWHAWIDGLTDGKSGSQVGYDMSPFAEKTIVHGGTQSMPFKYENTSFAFSEATRTFDSLQDWTARGIQSLSLWFHGTAGNGGQMYVKINNTKVAYDGEAADLARVGWQAWNIDLSKAGNVGSVRSLTIGIEGAGASGTLYVDDIRLYPKTPEYITPVQPADTDLRVWWPLNEGTGTVAVDHSGNGHDGAFASAPQWVGGYDGSALNFDDVDDSVIYRFPDETWSAYTLTVWAKADVLGQANNSSICATYGTATTNGFQLSFDAADHYQYHAGVDQIFGPASLEWVHLAVTYDGMVATAYYNGVPVATFTPAPDDLLANKYAIGVNRAEDNWFDGTIDDFRVYNRALTAAEVAGLAGRQTPIHKPF